MPGSTSTSGIGKFSASDDNASQWRRRVRGACTDAARGRRSRSASGVAQPRQFALAPRLDRSRARRARRRAPALRASRSSARRDVGRSLAIAIVRGRAPRVVTKRMSTTTRAPCPRPARHVGLRLAANLGLHRAVIASRDACRDLVRLGRARTATARSPRGCCPARRRRPPPLDRARPGTSGARRGSAIESSSDRLISVEVVGVQAVHERAEIGPLLHRVVQRHRRCRAARAPWRSRFRDQDGRRPPSSPARDRQRARCRAATRANQHEAAADARRDVVGVRRAGAEPLAFERARQSASPSSSSRRAAHLTATTAAAALAALPPRPLDSGSPLRMVQRRSRAAHRASSAAPGPRRRRVRSRLARQPAAVTLDGVDGHAARDERAPSLRSPGSSRAKPRTSKPQATFDTVAGANAVTEVMSGSSCRWSE